MLVTGAQDYVLSALLLLREPIEFWPAYPAFLQLEISQNTPGSPGSTQTRKPYFVCLQAFLPPVPPSPPFARCRGQSVAVSAWLPAALSSTMATPGEELTCHHAAWGGADSSSVW